MKVAGIQFACSDDSEVNLQTALKILDVALAEGARIVCFQELFNLRWFPRDRDERAFRLADVMGTEAFLPLKEKARQADAVLLLPFFERDEGRFFNSCLVVEAGEITGIYRKIHIPDIPLWEEQYYFAVGDKGLPVFQTRHGSIGIQLSWDNLYPEGARILALKGADLIFSPTACAFKSQRIWETMLTSNAIANGVYVMRVNRVGSEQSHDFYGMSFCSNPEGDLIGGPTGVADSILIADIDFAYLQRVRREWPLMKGRRPELYGEILTGV